MSAFVRRAEIPSSLRTHYLRTLPEPQEWFLEELVRSGDVWEAPGEAYAIFCGEQLVEFFAANHDEAPFHLATLVRQRPFKKALAKSFDDVLMDAARALGWALVETGFLFRKRRPVSLTKGDSFQLRKARLTDLPDVWECGRDFYGSRDEVEQIFRSDGLWIAFSEGLPVGSGIMIPIDGTGTVVDIGMVIRPDQRNRGFASLVVSELADVLERQGKRPICGCAEGNVASKAALENAGFVSEHRLVQISIPD